MKPKPRDGAGAQEQLTPAGAVGRPPRRRPQRQDRPFALRDRAHGRTAAAVGQARDRARHGRGRHPDHQHRSDAGRHRRHFARARAERGLLHPARAPPGRRRRQRRRPVRRRDRARPDVRSRRARDPQAVAGGPGRAQGRTGSQVRSAGVRRARHRVRALRRRDAAVLRARRRTLVARHRDAVARLPRPHHHRSQHAHGFGQVEDHVRVRPDQQGRRSRGRGRRRDVAAVAPAQAAAGRRAHDHRARDAGAAARPGARPHGAARHLDRPAGALAPVRRVRAARRRARGRDPGARRRAAQSGQPQAARRHPVRQVRTAGRHQDQDRRLVDRRARARRAGRAGPRAAAQDPRLAAGVEAQVDLHRRAAGLRQSRHPPRAHELRARRDPDRAALLVRAEPAEHPGAHRGRPQDQARVRGVARHQARLRRLFADRAAAARPRSPASMRSRRRSATASTSMR